MSLIYFDINNEYGSLAIWKIEEPSSFFSNHLSQSAPDSMNKKNKRELEWLTSRYLAQKLDGVLPDDIIKDEYGKPNLKSSRKHVSISHSHNFAAYASHEKEIGFDLQVFNKKIENIASKYTSEEESKILDDSLTAFQKLHIIWTIKEAAYKLYGKKELPFKSGIQLSNSKMNGKEIHTTGQILKNSRVYNFSTNSVVYPSYCYSRCIYNPGKE